MKLRTLAELPSFKTHSPHSLVHYVSARFLLIIFASETTTPAPSCLTHPAMSILKAKLTQQIMANIISVGAPLAMDMMDCKICHYDQGPANPANFDPQSRLAIIAFWHEYILSAAPGIGSSANITALCWFDARWSSWATTQDVTRRYFSGRQTWFADHSDWHRCVQPDSVKHLGSLCDPQTMVAYSFNQRPTDSDPTQSFAGPIDGVIG